MELSLASAGVTSPWLPLLALGLLAAVGVVVWQRLSGRRLKQRFADAQRRISDLTSRDRVTDTLARTEFERELDAAATRCDRGAGSMCVLSVSLDEFGQVNDAHGHLAGDAALRHAAERLAAAAAGRPLARLAGAEFVVLETGNMRAARSLAAGLLESLRQPIRLGDRSVSLVASVGIAEYPTHGARQRLIGHAGLAMRAAARAGGGGYAEYVPAIGVGFREQLALRDDLRSAVERGQFELVYQPKVDACSLQITGAEALLRWNHPVRGVISPEVFIPLAERHGLVGAIGNWVIDEACRQAGEWRDLGLRMRVAVNLSGYQVRQDDLVDRIEAALRQHRLVPSRFTCEITESVAMEDTQVTVRTFDRLGRAGLHVSIDDFGTGYSSLASLRRLPAAELKIDREFVLALDTGEGSGAIVRAIVQMAHSLGLRVVAEGVETAAQRDRLVALGCDELQGFLFARPMSPRALALWAGDTRSDAERAFRASLFEETAASPLGD